MMKKNRTALLQWVLAVIVSVMLWIVSMEQIHFEIDSKLPVAEPALPPEYMVLDSYGGDSVRVSFAGEGIGVLRDQIMKNPESVQVDLVILDQGQGFPFRISREFSGTDIVFKGGGYTSLTASEFNPTDISFIIDRTVSRELPVGVSSTSAIPQRYYWQVTSHDEITVEGAESIVNILDSCYTQPVTPGIRNPVTGIVKPDGVVYINPSSVSAELVPPVQVITQLDDQCMY